VSDRHPDTDSTSKFAICLCVPGSFRYAKYDEEGATLRALSRREDAQCTATDDRPTIDGEHTVFKGAGETRGGQRPIPHGLVSSNKISGRIWLYFRGWELDRTLS
jgi:hypothetical protein